jgi:amino acid transporter
VPFYALAVAAIFVVRKRPDYDPQFRTPLYPIVPALFILATLFLLGNALLDATSRWPTIVVLAIILLGVPVYYATVRRATPQQA